MNKGNPQDDGKGMPAVYKVQSAGSLLWAGRESPIPITSEDKTDRISIASGHPIRRFRQLVRSSV